MHLFQHYTSPTIVNTIHDYNKFFYIQSVNVVQFFETQRRYRYLTICTFKNGIKYYLNNAPNQ